MITDDDLFALCVWDEAAGEPFEGKAAVAKVILNRMAALYESDGTVPGTVLKKFQFSGFWFAMRAGHYTQIEWNEAGAWFEATRLLAQATGPQQAEAWADCKIARAAAAPGSTFAGGPEWRKLFAEPRALLYCNTEISHPTWATAEAQVARIYHHTFFRAQALRPAAQP